jgi:TusA-related sulfurtransferase
VNKKTIKEYRAWKAMKARCYAPSNRTNHNKHYHLKGIVVCDRWKNDYEQFVEDVGKAPNKDYTLERINNDGNYCPDNCVWVHKSMQSKNRGSFNKVFTHEGKTKNLKDWARFFGVCYTSLHQRLYKHMDNFEDAVKRLLLRKNNTKQ